METFRNGDIGLTRIKEGSFVRMLIDFVHIVFGYPRLRWLHAYLIYQDAGQWMIVEADVPAVGTRPLTQRTIDSSDFFRVPSASEQQRQGAIDWALAQKGTPYGYWTCVLIAIDQILNLLLGRKWARAQDLICTELTVTAYRQQQIDLLPGVRADRVLPDMIGDSALVEPL
jgi:uncharacterized protein YycO